MSSRLRAIAKARALHILAKRTDKEHEAAAARAAAEELARRYRLTQDETAEVTVDTLLHMLGVPGDGKRVWPLGLLLVLTQFFGTTPKVRSVDSYGVVDDPDLEAKVRRTCELHRDLRLEVARQGGTRKAYGMAFVHGLATSLENPFVVTTTKSEARDTVVTAIVPADFASEEARIAWDEIGLHARDAYTDPHAQLEAARGYAHGQRVGTRLLRERQNAISIATPARLVPRKNP